ncbi:MAG: RluA family pseudouridine synthase [Planctomycetes bacterium]|nr:RluA family pseudouridine synthase [Planctomycetota bacterium]
MTESLERTVSPADDGIRLDVFLANQPEVGTRVRARDLIDLDRVEIEGQRPRPGLFLPVGTAVRFRPEPAAPRDPLEPDKPLPEIPVLYEDASLCAIDKPVGLAAHPTEDRRFCEHTVASWAKARYGELPWADDRNRPGIVHRLDRETSGVMVIAKTPQAFDFLRAQFKVRTAQKEYRCIVYGEPRFQSDWIEKAIATDPRHPDRMTTVDEGGRESSTFYEVLERFGDFAHVRCRPKTGRTHQIRVHMTAIGHSLVGDRVYRSRIRQHERLPQDAPDPGRQCLHALRLCLPHPQTEETIELEAPLPADFEALLAWLRLRQQRARKR